VWSQNKIFFLVYKFQQDAQVTEFILSEDCSTCFAQQDAQGTDFLCLRTALRVLGFTFTHLQEHKTTVTTVPGNDYTVLLSAAIAYKLENSHQFQLIHDSSRQHYGVMVTRYCSYSCFVLLKMGDSDAQIM